MCNRACYLYLLFITLSMVIYTQYCLHVSHFYNLYLSCVYCYYVTCSPCRSCCKLLSFGLYCTVSLVLPQVIIIVLPLVIPVYVRQCNMYVHIVNRVAMLSCLSNISYGTHYPCVLVVLVGFVCFFTCTYRFRVYLHHCQDLLRFQ